MYTHELSHKHTHTAIHHLNYYFNGKKYTHIHNF